MIKGGSANVELLIGPNTTRMPKRAFVLPTPSIQKDDVSMKNRHKAYCRLVALDRGPVGEDLVVSAKEGAQRHPSYQNLANIYLSIH